MTKKSKSKYELLRNKVILEILDGDTDFGEILPKDGSQAIKRAMPYLSGPELCEISTKFGLVANYGWNGGALSRWVYLDNSENILGFNTLYFQLFKIAIIFLIISYILLVANSPNPRNCLKKVVLSIILACLCIFATFILVLYVIQIFYLKVTLLHHIAGSLSSVFFAFLEIYLKTSPLPLQP